MIILRSIEIAIDRFRQRPIQLVMVVLLIESAQLVVFKVADVRGVGCTVVLVGFVDALYVVVAMLRFVDTQAILLAFELILPTL